MIATEWILALIVSVEIVFFSLILWRVNYWGRATYGIVADTLEDPTELADALADSLVGNAVGSTIAGLIRGVRDGFRDDEPAPDGPEPAPAPQPKKPKPSKPAPTPAHENGVSPAEKVEVVKVKSDGP